MASLQAVGFRACPSSPQHRGKLTLMSSEQRTLGDPKMQGNHSTPKEQQWGQSSPGPYRNLLLSMKADQPAASVEGLIFVNSSVTSTHNPITMPTGGLCFETNLRSKVKWPHPRHRPLPAMPVDYRKSQ